MTDQESFLIAIRAEPKDDTRRLAYADWLDEHDEPVRAKFIRLQIRIAALQHGCWCGACIKLSGGGQHHNGPCTVDRERDELPDGRSQQAFLRKQERELFEQHAVVWFDTPELDRIRLQPYGVRVQVKPYGIVRRGFVDEVRCQLAMWVGEPCPPHTRETSHSGHSAGCTRCHGTGRIESIAAAVMAVHPVTVCVLTDVLPADAVPTGHARLNRLRLAGVDNVGEPGEWFFREWDAPIHGDPGHDIPTALFEQLPGAKIYPGEEHLKFFASAALAHAALSAAAVAWGKAEDRKKEGASAV